MEETFTNNYKYLQTFVVVCKWTGSNKQVMANKINLTTMKKQIILFLLMTISLSSIGQLSCTATSTNEHCGMANGTATVTVTDTCPSGFTYLWSNSDTTATITGLPAGVYTVTVTCGTDTCIESTQVNNLPGPMVIILSVTNSACNQANGGATVTAINGVPPYTFNWSNSQTGPSLVNVMAGTYTVTVTDSVYCDGWSPVIIIDTLSPTCSITNIINVSVAGGSDGSIVVTATGGTPPYIYVWSTIPPQTGSVASNVVAGTYTVTVCDSNNCCCTSSGTVQDGSSVSEIVIIDAVSIYPNPTYDAFSIDLSNINEKIFTIEISDIIGNIVYSKDINNITDKTFNVDISELSNGFYSLKIYNSRFTVNKKIMKE